MGVAALLRRSNGSYSDAAVALTNMGERPLRASGVERRLLEGGDASSAAEAAALDTSPPSDTFASAEYRQYLVTVLVRRAIDEANSR